jgi:hypothetical protein
MKEAVLQLQDFIFIKLKQAQDKQKLKEWSFLNKLD